MLKVTKMYTNKKNGEIITEREFSKLAKGERKDFRPTTGLNHTNYRN